MNLQPSALQNEIAAAAREWLAKQLPLARVRELAAGAGALPDEATWAAYAESGWFGLGLDQQHGGLGLGAAEEAVLFRELGRALAPGPVLATVLAAHTMQAAGPAELTAALVGGRRRAALTTQGRVLDGGPGDLVLAVDESGVTVSQLHDCSPAEPVDPLTRVAHLGGADVLLRVDDPSVLTRAHVLATAQLLGIVEAVCDISVAYARTRTQFGKPIGSFQAVKHRTADMAVTAYAVTGQLFHAAAAYLVAARGATRAATDTIQNLGGIGFTWEHDAHLYLKRAHVLANCFGPLRGTHARIMAPERHEFA